MVPYKKTPLPRSFYSRHTLEVAPELLGKILVHEWPDGEVLAARIVEVEAYLGELDPASHAYRGPRGRAAIMYGPVGKLYVYFTYGMHFCMNAVAHDGSHAGAVLLRAGEPLVGVEHMHLRRGRDKAVHQLARGPACLTSALAITRDHNGTDLVTGAVRIHPPRRQEALEIGAGTRIGISQAADRPWRFFIRGHQSVSGSPGLNRG